MPLPNAILAPIARALEARGYEDLTPVQSAVIEAEAAGRDLLVSAQTGSGKTVAFGMAIAPTLLGDAETLPQAAAPLALAIAPTRELALQVQRELDWLYGDMQARTASCVGGMDPRSERRALERGAHVVVGTPGRLRDHITRGALDLSNLRAVVLDEADEMLDLGFREDLEFILAAAPESRRTLLFSATVPRPIAELAKTFQRDALRITAAGAGEQHADIEYKLMSVPASDREHAVINTLLWFDAVNAIVFASTRESVKHLSARLHNRGFGVVTLSGELSQAERTAALQAMRDGRARICVATDVAARGIDLPNLDLVIHAELPMNAETLLHRSGRTGRAGRKGTCVVITPSHRKRVALSILRTARVDAELIGPPTAADIEAKVQAAILADPVLDLPVAEDEMALVEQLLERHSPQVIAAAYLRQQFAARPAAEDIIAEPVEPAGRGVEHMQGGTWFKISLGRKQRAEPRWLIPLLCKAGGLTKADIGSIRLFQNETAFEISADKATDFLATVARNGTGERSVRIWAESPGMGDRGRSERPDRQDREERTHRPRPQRAEAPSFDPLASAMSKPRKFRKGAEDGVNEAPARAPGPVREAKAYDESVAPAKRKDKPSKAKPVGKDKGKPKWAKPAADPGAAPRKRKAPPQD